MAAAAFLAWGAPLAAAAPSVTLVQPSAEECTLAPLRDFTVIGRLEDMDKAVNVRIELFDEKRRLVRQVVSSVDVSSRATPKDMLELNYKHGKYYVEDKNASLIDNPSPDIVKGSGGKAFKNPSNKAVVNRKGEFAATILGGASKNFDTAYGDDKVGSYGDLAAGKYTLQVTATDAATGAVIAETKRKLVFAGADRLVLGRLSPKGEDGYAHKENLEQFAAARKVRLRNDFLPGYWNRPRNGDMKEVFYEIPLRWRLNDAQEYIMAKNFDCVIYNISEGSTVQNVELGALAANDYIDNPSDKAHSVNFYHYDIGDIEVSYQNGLHKEISRGKLVPFESKNDITRVEIRRVQNATLENDYWPLESKKTVDFDISDGVKISFGEYISIFGVTTPIRTSEVERADDNDVFKAGTYSVKNRIDAMEYKIITPSGREVEVKKPVGLKRHYFVNKVAPSIYEYKHILGGDVFSERGSYIVSMQGVDKNGAQVDATEKSFTVIVE